MVRNVTTGFVGTVKGMHLEMNCFLVVGKRFCQQALAAKIRVYIFAGYFLQAEEFR